MTLADAKAEFDQAMDFVPEQPRPLVRDTPPGSDFPVEALGPILKPVAHAIHDLVRAPLAIGAQSVLATASLIAQAHADVRLPIGQTRPLSQFFVTVALSGERKTTCDNEALRPVRTREWELKQQYDVEIDDWAREHAVWKAERQKVLNSKSYKSMAERKAALDRLGDEPEPPLKPMLTCPEPTFEGLCRLLREGHPSVGLFSSEGGQFLGGYGMSEDNRLKTAAALCGLWDGEPVKRVRGGDGIVILHGRRVALHLMVQPGVSAGLFADPLLKDQGLLSRLLATLPESAMGQRFHRSLSEDSQRIMEDYTERFLFKITRQPPLIEGKRNELAPRPLLMSAAATELWFEFGDHVEAQLMPDGTLHPISSFANKLPEHAARLAGILALVEDLDAAAITATHLEQGIALTNYYTDEALRLHQMSQVSSDLQLANKLLNWLQTKWNEPQISLVEIYQRGPNVIRDKKTAARLVGILEDHGWLQQIEGGGEVSGTRRREVWAIVRQVDA